MSIVSDEIYDASHSPLVKERTRKWRRGWRREGERGRIERKRKREREKERGKGGKSGEERGRLGTLPKAPLFLFRRPHDAQRDHR